jgi:signal transduction histidine kinase
MTTTDGKYSTNRRTLHGLLIQPHKQFGFVFIYIGGGLLALTIIMFYLLALLDHNFTQLAHVYNIAPDVAQAMHDSIRLARITLGIPTAVILVITFYAGLRLSHKIFGPFIPFARHVNELKSGNYASRVHLRDGDEFQDFKDALNELAVTLQKKG